MKLFVGLIFIFLINSFNLSKNNEIIFHVDLKNCADDKFKVTAFINGLKKSNDIYQFASTAPGTYQTMDIGRYVYDFKAFDEDGNEIKTTQISTNQYQISAPEKLEKITYSISETWDTSVDSNQIYRMCGTSIEDDHVLINGQGVFGYFTGKQSIPLKIKLTYPEKWLYGTALSLSNDGYFLAKNYDHIVDSPILLGRLTKSSVKVENTDVEIYTYSKTDKINSQQILDSMKDMLLSASKFMNGLPVNRYTFLFHFEDVSHGAWEHSYSSEYVYEETDFEKIRQSVLETAAHEFFHIVTPLNIHSEIIRKFNFVNPTTSDHLWLYEGVTEWASHMMLFKGELVSLDDYLKMLQRKVLLDNYFPKDYSLVDLARNSFSKKGQKLYGNIYYRGAIVAGLLDIKLLELSNGTRGLREVINELATEYGQNKPFNEKKIFDIFVKKTFPEIENFFQNYVIKSKPLPIKEYYNLIGIDYIAKLNNSGEKNIKFIFRENKSANENQLKLRKAWMKKL
jgi:predicted metalloprotease with PDZ domain